LGKGTKEAITFTITLSTRSANFLGWAALSDSSEKSSRYQYSSWDRLHQGRTAVAGFTETY
jgi:hypothetical protein